MGLALSNAGMFLTTLLMTTMWVTFFKRLDRVDYRVLYVNAASCAVVVISDWIVAAYWDYKLLHVLALCYAMCSCFVFAILGTVWQEGQQK